MLTAIEPRFRLVALLTCAAVVACGPVGEPGPEPGPDIEERAGAALTPLKQRLMAELTAALAEGPPHAIEVCSVRAPEIGAEVAGEGVRVGRTSHRLRNPDNAPEPWMEPLLAGYLANPDDRSPHTVRIDEGTMGYVEPILVQEMCLTCHGESIAPAVGAKLRELYPEDAATGFEAGDFRGMFWVTVPVAPAKG